MKVKLIIPDNWNDITIHTYQKYLSIQESKKRKKLKLLILLLYYVIPQGKWLKKWITEICWI